MRRHRSVHARHVLLVALILALGGAKLAYNPGIGRGSIDGNYYYQIARNVESGVGLKTNVSLYHQGLKTFPGDVNQAPLWPALLGLSGRVFGLEAAAKSVPEILYLLDLLLLYALVRRLMRRFSGRDLALGPLDPGHVAVLLFGLNPLFFEFTSKPYTEGLAFTMLFSALLTADRAAMARSIAWAAVAGALAALAFLSRVQMIGVMVALPLAFAAAAARDRKLWLLGASALAGTAVALVPWVLHVATWLKPLTPELVLGLALPRETRQLQLLSDYVFTRSLWDFLIDPLSGFAVAFNPFEAKSYVRSYGWAVYLVPIAGVRLLLDRRGMASLFRTLTSPRGVLGFALILCGAALLAPLHILHFRLFPWSFGWRHGLPFLLPLILAAGYLVVRGGRLGRWVTVGLLAVSIGTGARAVSRMLLAPTLVPHGLVARERQLVDWLDAQSPTPVSITTQPQLLSVFSHSYFHWIGCRGNPVQTMRLLLHGAADYLIVLPGESGCSFVAQLAPDLDSVRVFGDPPRQIRVLTVPGRARTRGAR